MSKKIDFAGSSAYTNTPKMVIDKPVPKFEAGPKVDASPKYLEMVKLEVLNISDCPDCPSKPVKMVPAGLPCLSKSCFDNIVVDHWIPPETNEKTKKKIKKEISEDKDTKQDEKNFPFPPTLYRNKMKKGEKDEFGSLTLMETPKKETGYDSDETVDNYVECGEKGICKCRKMRGRNYYEYYMDTKDKEDYTLYPKGKCVLPRGTVLHFTDAPDKMRREDVAEALGTLGAKIEFLEYQCGNKEGWARLSFPYEGRVIIKKMNDNKLNIAGATLTFRVLSGKEEKRYLLKAIEGIFRVQQKAKSLNKRLQKAGYDYVKKYNDSEGGPS